MKKAIICYVSFSGNTREVAETIEEHLKNINFEVDLYWIGTGSIPDLSKYDLILIGTFTWGEGETPEEMKDFVLDIGYKPSNVYVFGTGDTQFGGDDLFCIAAEKLSKFYESPLPPLKIEQSPRGAQELLVEQWIKGVVDFNDKTDKG
ncbi:flavodoxin [Siminovitchia fordii]|uniref:Flavodoxin n=1 Tax=Siminovitchia fordii TaxID=254759 RepID=A0ABQ4K9W2_9BACI|nr:flavodoxin [Siminovitchia fordii]GIN22508.1 flavodoxin [Siminovitchia fordii]